MKILITLLFLFGLFRLTNAQTPVANAGPDDSVCSLSYTLQAVPSIGLSTWYSISGPGSLIFTNPNSATSTIMVGMSGSYTLVWTENNGGLTDSDTVIIQLTQTPSSTFTASPINCFGDYSTIVYTGNASVSATYNWNFNGGNAIPGTGVGPHTVTWTNTGSHYISLTVSQDGCTSSVSSFSVTNPTQLIIAGISYTNELCNGASMGTIYVSPYGGTIPYSYLWNNGAITENQSGLSAGIYTVTITDYNGCTTFHSTTILEPEYLNLSATSNSPVCVGDSLSFNSSVSGGACCPYVYTYSWIGPDGFNSTLPNPIISVFDVINAGQYTLLVTDGNGCSSIDTVNVYDCSILQNCSAQFILEPDTIPHHYNVINNASGVPPIEYLWSWGDGTYDSTAYPTHTYNSAGTYTICLTITDSVSCTSIFCDSSYLQKSPNAIIYINVIQPDNIGINENKLTNSISIYPNPTNGKLTISHSDKLKLIEVFNLLGEKIYCSNPNNAQTTTEIDLANVPKGIYFVKVDNGENVLIEKVVLN